MLTTNSLYMPALISVEIKILRQLAKLRRLKGQYSKQVSKTGLFYYFAHFFNSFLLLKNITIL